MGEQVRRSWLLVVTAAVAVLAVVAGWPTERAVATTPVLYLARDPAPVGASPTPDTFLAVGDGPRLLSHLLQEGENPASLEIIDGAGRVVRLKPDGQPDPTGVVHDPVAVRDWLKQAFVVRADKVRRQVLRNPSSACATAKAVALGRLNLPTQQGVQGLTLAETLAEADTRIAAMHQPANDIPLECLPNPNHRGGYLHNLWHRLTGT